MATLMFILDSRFTELVWSVDVRTSSASSVTISLTLASHLLTESSALFTTRSEFWHNNLNIVFSKRVGSGAGKTLSSSLRVLDVMLLNLESVLLAGKWVETVESSSSSSPLSWSEVPVVS